ncbi:MAG TPA: sortase [bacterium]|nr:sortase [bacterium]
MKRLSAAFVIVGLGLLTAPLTFGFLTNVRVGQQQLTEQTQWRVGLEARQTPAVPSVLVSTTTAQAPSGARQTAAPRKSTAPASKVSSAAVAPPFLLSIPKIKLRWMIHEGTTIRHLRRTGAGHIPRTALPGQRGVVGIAGHRTTYGAPFFKLNRVGIGDDVILQTRGGTFVYRVYKVRTVKPSKVEVLKPMPGQRLLVLSTCTPPYSAKFRLVVFAKLVPAPSAASSHAN